MDAGSFAFGAITGGSLIALAVIVGSALRAHQPVLADRLAPAPAAGDFSLPGDPPVIHHLEAPPAVPPAMVLHTYPPVNRGYCAISDTGEVRRFDGDLAGDEWKRAFEAVQATPDRRAGWTYYHDGVPRGRVERG